MSEEPQESESAGLARRFADALRDHVGHPGPESLRSASELGRAAHDAGHSMGQLLGLHLDPRRPLVQELGVDCLGDVDAFLLAVLASFELAERGESRVAVAAERERADLIRALTEAYVAIAAHAMLKDRLDEVCIQTKRFFGAADVTLTFGRASSEPAPRGDVMSAPLRAGGRLAVVAPTGRTWSERDRTTLRQLAILISSPVDDARRLEFAQRSARVGRLLGGLAHPEEVLARVRRQGADEIGADWVQLQDPGMPTPGPVAEDVRHAAATGEAVFHDGTDAAWAVLPLGPEDAAELVMVIGFDDPAPFDEVQRVFLRDVAGRVSAALERSGAYERERSIRRQVEVAAARLRELEELAAHLGRASTKRRVAQILLRRAVATTSAAGGLIVVRSDAGSVEELAASGPLRRLREDVLTELTRRAPPRRRPAAPATVPLAALPAFAAAHLRKLGIRTLVRYEVMARATELAVVFIGWRDGTDPDRADLDLVQGLMDIAGPNLLRAERFDVEHEIADTLQRSMMEMPPLALPGVRSATYYRAGSAGLAGGDWYDLIALDDHRLAIAVGDIVGRGVHAAAVMGQVRSTTRGLAAVIADPAELVTVLDGLTSTTGRGRFSSLVYAVIDVHAGEVTTCLAGHPPPILRLPDGTTSLIDDERGPLLGVEGSRRASTRRVPNGTQFVAYTDGLIEQRGQHIDLGIASIIDAVGADRREPDDLCAGLAQLAHPADHRGGADDVAIVVVQLDGTTEPT